MMRRLMGSLGVWGAERRRRLEAPSVRAGVEAILWASVILGAGCTPSERDFNAAGGAGGSGG
ncbi:MAG TPA: hypothetical protein PK156_47135, partial [Polyangium sp.]|nr:hypothetical protein [Polyangium sp.]